MNGQKKREPHIENVLSLIVDSDIKDIAFRIADLKKNYNMEEKKYVRNISKP